MQGAAFALDSYGNGAAYTFRALAAPASSVFLQDEDAATFRDELDRLETLRPDDSPDQILSWLWDQCDYGSAAQAD